MKHSGDIWEGVSGHDHHQGSAAGRGFGNMEGTFAFKKMRETEFNELFIKLGPFLDDHFKACRKGIGNRLKIFPFVGFFFL